MATKRTPLASDVYRKELRAVARGDDTGPHPIPSDEQIGAVLGDLPGRPVGSIEMCPGCRQPIAWDGLGWTHATTTECEADLTVFDPQQTVESEVARDA